MPWQLYPDIAVMETFSAATLMLTMHFGSHVQSQLSPGLTFGQPNGVHWTRVPRTREEADDWVIGARSGLRVPGVDRVPGIYGDDSAMFNPGTDDQSEIPVDLDR